MKDLKVAFMQNDLLLTAAVAVGEKYIKAAYDIQKIHKYYSYQCHII